VRTEDSGGNIVDEEDEEEGAAAGYVDDRSSLYEPGGACACPSASNDERETFEG
jgi:hypothetical protein